MFNSGADFVQYYRDKNPSLVFKESNGKVVVPIATLRWIANHEKLVACDRPQFDSIPIENGAHVTLVTVAVTKQDTGDKRTLGHAQVYRVYDNNMLVFAINRATEMAVLSALGVYGFAYGETEFGTGTGVLIGVLNGHDHSMPRAEKAPDKSNPQDTSCVSPEPLLMTPPAHEAKPKSKQKQQDAAPAQDGPAPQAPPPPPQQAPPPPQEPPPQVPPDEQKAKRGRKPAPPPPSSEPAPPPQAPPAPPAPAPEAPKPPPPPAAQESLGAVKSAGEFVKDPAFTPQKGVKKLTELIAERGINTVPASVVGAAEKVGIPRKDVLSHSEEYLTYVFDTLYK